MPFDFLFQFATDAKFPSQRKQAAGIFLVEMGCFRLNKVA
jgi:hypothetical protein